MKKFLIKVNGSQYEVEVEEIGKGNFDVEEIHEAASTRTVPAAPAPSPAPAAPKAAAPAAPAKNTTSAAVPAGAQTISAPMPGVINSVNVNSGDSIKKGDILLILEAMKMENEIISPVDGTIASVNVSKGASVNAGDVLLSINK
ncbi:MAG TPA: biotin/lipoyl-binding protein [Clostridiales bacterium]|nr:biotin/lipoyl-binding protein [Clostridiales bacterium]